MTPMFPRIAIIGLGLIGSSVARGAREFHLAKHIVAADRNPLSLEYALQKHIIDEGLPMADAVKDADLVVLAVPPSALAHVAETIAPHLKSGALVTDTASVKQMTLSSVNLYLPKTAAFVPSHPIAGSENSGVKAGKSDLFAGKRVILTPQTPEDEGIEAITTFWQTLGATVEYMPADIHDKVYAYVSHLPQLLAFAVKDVVEPFMEHAERDETFRRFTRICASDPVLWDDIFEANLGNLEEAIARFMALLQRMREELLEGAEDTLTDALDPEIYTLLLPTLLSSCLIGAIYQEERTIGLNFKRYGGGGFKDFTAPLAGEPDNSLENISKKANNVVRAMDAFAASLSHLIVMKA
jgi:cyclohexadieny/prephenate dehydrogenase